MKILIKAKVLQFNQYSQLTINDTIHNLSVYFAPGNYFG